LVVAWLLAALRSGGPYPLLAISGEHGSAKTVLSKFLRALVDPNVAAVRALPREERELMIAAAILRRSIRRTNAQGRW
jgi:ABC-type phosphonate transport system ATPase subunit